VEPRARRQALRLHLAEARSALDRGDPQAARDSVAAALEIDPNYLAAQVLLERIEQFGPVPVAQKPPEEQACVSAMLPEGWARFEQRTRQRRVEKRAAAARSALNRGRLDDAQAIMAEIREIDEGHPELISLQMELDAAMAPSTRSSRRGPLAAAVAAFCATLLGAYYFENLDTSLPGATTRPGPGASTVPAVPSTLGSADTSPSMSGSGDTTPSVSVGAGTKPSLGADAGQAALNNDSAARDRPAMSREPGVPTPRATRGEAETAAPSRQVTPSRRPEPATERPITLPEPTPLLAPRGSDTPQSAPDREPSSNQAVSQVSLPRSVAEPLASAETAPLGFAAPAPPRVPAASEPAAAAFAPPRDEDLVRGVLQQYRRAYDQLDAQSAAAVWPHVDISALQRAFEGLASQRLTFDRCDVKIQSRVGTAVCHGSTSYVPKVGSRETRMEPRVWTFGLQKIGDDWQIQTARAQQ
jgi:hypothetical protein